MSTPSLAELIAASGRPLDTPIHDLGLTWHTTKPLTDNDLPTLGHLAKRTDAELLEIDGFGARRLQKLKGAIGGAS